MSFKAVIFDFDGTVADTGRGVRNSIKYAVREFGIPVGDESALDYFIGPPLYESFEHVYGVDSETAAELVDTYRIYYAAKGIYELDAYPGLLELLANLKAAGVKLAVASSKPLHFLKTAVDTVGATEYFDFIIGPELNNHEADKSELIRSALNALEITEDNYRDVVMVGDRFYDIDGAKAVGISSVGITFGYGKRPELEAAEADKIVDSVEELSAYLSA